MTERWNRLLDSSDKKDKLDKFYTGIDKVPNVIDKNLIIDNFYLTCSKDFRKLKPKEDIQYGEVDVLYLDSQEILRIDHLWMLENLTVLSLAHNYIEKIENLDQLVNLVELNLSFNKIELIEGLDTLTKIEVLSLYNNKITALESLDYQQELKILSIGNNFIEDQVCIAYLSKFKKLISLNMANNPCTNFDMFKESLAAFLPSLVYYNYEYITEDERKIGEEINKEELAALGELERKKRSYLMKLKEYKEKTSFLKNSYIDGLESDNFFHEMFKKDPDGLVFKDSTDKFTDIYERLRLTTFDVCLKIHDAGADNYRTRIDEVEVFRQNSIENSVNASKRLTLATSRVSSRLKNHMLRARSYFKGAMTKQLKKDEKSLKLWLQGLRVLKDFADRYLDEQRFNLMRVEMKTSEMNEETISMYDRNLADIMNVFIEETQSQFTRLREAENDCLEEISNKLHKLMNEVYKTDEFHNLPPQLQSIMYDRESLTNAIAASHDCHTLVIDTKEDSIISRLKGWHRQQTGDLLKNETQRNRKVVLEIDRYIEKLKKEFEKRICGVLKLFQFLEPHENFEEDLDEIIKCWLKEKKTFNEILGVLPPEEKYSDEVPEELKEVFTRPFIDDFLLNYWTCNTNVH